MATLPPKQAAFVRHVLAGESAARAYVLAGYTKNKKAAATCGPRMARRAAVKAAIDAGQAKTAKRFELERDEMLRELHRIAVCDPGQAFDENGRLLPVHKMPDNVRRSLSGYDVDELWAEVPSDGERPSRAQVGDTKKLKFWGKVDALKLALTHLGELKGKGENAPLDALSDDQVKAKLDGLLAKAVEP